MYISSKSSSKRRLNFVLYWFVNTGLIRAEENRILFEMCQTISQNRAEIRQAVTAIAEIDVFRAKAKVGARMRGIIPEVRTSYHVIRQTLILFFCLYFPSCFLQVYHPYLFFYKLVICYNLISWTFHMKGWAVVIWIMLSVVVVWSLWQAFLIVDLQL